MNEAAKPDRRSALLRTAGSLGAGLAVWSMPVVRSVLLPVHAQTSAAPTGDGQDNEAQAPVCIREDIIGRWQLTLFGVAASTSEIQFNADGTAEHELINLWQYVDGELQMMRGTVWLLTGRFSGCSTLAGDYLNIFTNPLLGNLIIREGEWVAVKVA